MRQFTPHEIDEASKYNSEKIQGLEVLILKDGTGIIQLDDKPFCELDITKGRIVFLNDQKNQNITIPNDIPLEDSIDIAMSLGELYAQKKMGAGNITEREPLPEHIEVPDYFKDTIEITRKHIVHKELEASDDYFFLHMQDSDAMVLVYYAENGHEIEPRIHIRRMGDEEFYNARDIPIEKWNEFEYTRTIDLMSSLPASALGERVSDWAIEFNNLAAGMMNDFQRSDYLEPINIETAMGNITIHAFPYDLQYGASNFTEVKCYRVSGKYEDTINQNTNIYELAADIMNLKEIEKEYKKDIQALQDIFVKEIYPNLTDFYCHSTYYPNNNTITPEMRRSFKQFDLEYSRLYHHMPISPQKNECLIKHFENKDVLDAYCDKLRAKMAECEEYLSELKAGKPHEEAVKKLSNDTVESQIIEIYNRYDAVPQNLAGSTLFPRKEIEDLGNRLLDERYKDSKLMDNLANRFSKGEVKASNGTEFDKPSIKAVLDFNVEGYKELYERANLEKMTGIPFDIFKHTSMMDACLKVEYPDNIARLEVAAYDSEMNFEHKSEVLLSDAQQELLRQSLRTKIRMPEEEYLALNFATDIIRPQGGYDVIYNNDGTSANFMMELSDDDINELMSRTNAFKLLDVDNYQDLTDCDQYLDAEVTITAQNVWVDLTSPDLDEPIWVPLGRKEKDAIREISKDVLKTPLKENAEKNDPTEIRKTHWNKRHPDHGIDREV